MRIFKRGNRWYYTIEIPSADGKRKRKTKGGYETKKQAKDEAVLAEAEVATGGYINESDITLKRCSEMWLKEYQRDVKATTLRVAVTYIKDLLIFFPSNIRLKDITKLKYQAYIDSKTLKPRSIKKIKAVHNNLFKYAVRNNLIKHNFIADIILPKKKRDINDKIEDRYLSVIELNKLLELSRETSCYTLFLLLAYTGMRIGEATALQWQDIENNIIHIRKNITTQGSVKHYQITTTKTKSSVRDIVISNTLITALKHHRQEQRYKRIASRSWHDADFVFTSPYHKGYPVCQPSVNRLLKQLAKQAGINKKVTLHILRHTHASLLAQAGVSLESIQERLGHSSCTITRDIYLHITKELKQDNADKFEKLMATIRQQ